MMMVTGDGWLDDGWLQEMVEDNELVNDGFIFG